MLTFSIHQHSVVMLLVWNPCMESKSVTLMLRFKDADGKWNRRPVARGANGRVKPGHALIDGKPVVEPAARRTLRVLVTVVLSFLLLSCGHLAAGQVSRDELNAELIQAAKDGNTAAAQQVLPFGASADAKDENGVTALMWAGQRPNRSREVAAEGCISPGETRHGPMRIEDFRVKCDPRQDDSQFT
jgi:hypothetical protein